MWSDSPWSSDWTRTRRRIEWARSTDGGRTSGVSPSDSRRLSIATACQSSASQVSKMPCDRSELICRTGRSFQYPGQDFLTHAVNIEQSQYLFNVREKKNFRSI